MRYRYSAYASTGQMVSGYVEANTRDLASGKLREQGMLIQSVKAAPKIKLSLDMDITTPKLNLRQQALFFSQLAMLIGGGVPVLQSLEVLRNTSGRPLNTILTHMVSEVETGMPLSKTMANRAPAFNAMAIQVLSVSEYSGELDRGLKMLAEQFDSEDALQRKFVSALIYPVTILVMAFALAIFMIMFIVPNYAGMFADLGAQLPWQTRALLAVSDFLVAHWYAVPILILAVIGFILASRRSEQLRYNLHRFYLKVPIFGPLMRNREVARYTRAIGTLMKAGIPVVTAARVTADVVENNYISKNLASVPDTIAGGSTLGKAIKDLNFLPPIFAELLVIGEMISSADQALEYVANLSEADVKQTVERLTSIMEPTFILILGGIVFVIVVPLLLPMFELYGNIQ